MSYLNTREFISILIILFSFLNILGMFFTFLYFYGKISKTLKDIREEFTKQTNGQTEFLTYVIKGKNDANRNDK